MKRLVLVRHAKAEPWGYDEDYSRALTDRGERDARKVSRALLKLGIIPDLMITSPAMRAIQTAMFFATEFEYPEKSIIKNRLFYEGLSSGELLEIVHRIKENYGSLFIFGHNPAMSSYARSFCRDFSGDMATCSAVVLDFPAERWDQISMRTGELSHLLNPKELPE